MQEIANIEFVHNPKTFRAVTADPDLYVEGLGRSKEDVRRYCLNWHGRRIVFTATLKQVGQPPGTVKYCWTILKLPNVDLHIPTYNFESLEQRRQAAELARRAMLVLLPPGCPLPGEEPIVTVEFSEFLKQLLATGHI